MRRWLAYAALLGAIGADQVSAEPELQTFRPLEIDGKQVRWLPRGSGAPLTLTYSIATSTIETPGAVNCANLRDPSELQRRSSITPDALRQALARAFARWSKTANLEFRESFDVAKADIVIGEQADPIGFAFTNVKIEQQRERSVDRIAAAQICLNPNRRWKIGFDGNLGVYDLEHTLAHEIGHAIGLDHPAGRHHVMSFKYHEAVPGLSAGDVRGAIALYGNKSTIATRSAVGFVNATPGEAIVGQDNPRKFGERALREATPMRDSGAESEAPRK